MVVFTEMKAYPVPTTRDEIGKIDENYRNAENQAGGRNAYRVVQFSFYFHTDNSGCQ